MLHLGKNIKIFADLPHYVSGNSVSIFSAFM